ncbi:MAG: hypothetical protein PHW83_08265, partial [Bacteroidales bacterium]|nr:hypothetical protein [Bacteroidales bacterium]
MKKVVYSLMILVAIFATSCNNETSVNTAEKKSAFKISEDDINETIRQIKEIHTDKESFRIEKGVKQVAALWQESDGDLQTFNTFCVDNFIADSTNLLIAYNKLEKNFELLFGSFNKMTVKLMEPLHLDMGEIHFVDEVMGAYSASSHLTEDLFANKLAFYVVLNFPSYSLEEKINNADKWSRLEWAYARMGDLFISRVPAELLQNSSLASTNADTYIADYNIYMGNLVNSELKTSFPSDMVLITHWGLRDELKSNYNTQNGFEKQKTIYNVMLRIVKQEIPSEVINNGDYQWDPITNKL